MAKIYQSIYRHVLVQIKEIELHDEIEIEKKERKNCEKAAKRLMDLPQVS
jgi:hypothetical protein